MSDGLTNVSPNDIAIVGMALRVSGARNLDEFWSNLRGGVECMRDVPPEELLAAGEPPELIRRKNYVARTAELPGLDAFDADFFGFSPKEAVIMDPQHRQFLECAWEAIEDSGVMPETVGSRVGVFAGCGMGSYFYFNVLSHKPLVDQVGLFLLRHTGNDKDFLATRASFLLDLKGPSVNIQTACSTSLVAVHYACQSLLSGECDMALAGGVTIELPHGVGYLHHEGEVLSPDGHCRAFDHRAAGTVFGSGAGVVVLRRLSDALADGDPIRAVIKGTAVNNDGASKAGYLAPSVSGQAEAIVEALGLAGAEADTIQYVECHGTGTYLGDPIEIAALTQAYRQSTAKTGYCRIGSVKTNIGHLDTAAGVASLIKSVLALEHEEIPASLNFEKPNPAIDFAGSPFVVNDRLSPWPRGKTPRRAAINSLGVGGTNAHAIIEEAPLSHPAGSPAASPADALPPQLLVYSSKSRKGLDDQGRRLSAFLASHPEVSLEDAAYTLFKGRRQFDFRRAVAVRDRADAIHVLSAPDSRRPGTHTPVEGVTGATFLFPGGGAQYVRMARDLYDKEPVFKAAVDEGLGYLDASAAADVRQTWLDAAAGDGPAAALLQKPSIQLPALLILEVALARLWISMGVKPSALIGHSMGENTAACLAGVMDFKHAVALVRLRGQLVDEIKGGAMLSVPLAAEAIAARLPEDLEIAVLNAPELGVVTGPAPAIEAFRETLLAEGIDATRIPIDAAGHSRLLDPILERFGAFLATIPLKAPQIPIVSNLTGTWLKPEEARDPKYWVRHFRSTVRFADGLQTLSADPGRVYIEVGPGRMLSSLAKAQGPINANQIINSLPHADEDVDDQLHFLTAAGRAWSTGLPVAIERLWQGQSPRRVHLPAYAFQHQRYFLPRLKHESDGEAGVSLVKKPAIEDWGWQPAWKPSYADVISGADLSPAPFLVFLDDTGAGEDLAARLRGLGHTVATVALGDAFRAGDDRRYTLCPEHGRDGYDRLLQHLTETGGIPQRIVHLWLLTKDETFRRGSSFFNRNQERGFYSLFWLAQALGNAGELAAVQINVLTNGMQRVRDEALLYPEKATVLGPALVMPRELQGTNVRVIDLPWQPDEGGSLWARMARPFSGVGRSPDPGGLEPVFWDDLFAKPATETVAYRDGRRYVRVHQPVKLTAPESGLSKLRPRGVYLVTGGLGGLGAVCAEELARQVQARIIITGRTALPDRGEWDHYVKAYGEGDRIGRAIAAIRRIEAAGGDVHYVRADVTNPDLLRAGLAEARAVFGPINGALHAAGIVRDELMAMKSASDIEDVLAPKVMGTLVLDDVLKDDPLDFLVLFSSTSTDTAPAGQADYVAANAFLNAFAEARAGRPGPEVIALHWGIWNEVGLAARAIDNPGTGGALADVEPAHTALFERRVSDAKGGDWLEFHAEPARHWVLDEHRLGSGAAIWPGTGYLEIVAEAAQELGIATPFEIDDLMFVKALDVPDGGGRRVRARPTREGGVTRLSIESEAAGGWVLNAEAHLRSVRRQPSRVIDIPALRAAANVRTVDAGGAALASDQEVHLKFGPRWKVLRSVHLGRKEAVARLALEAPYRSDLDRGFLLHPALLDIATGYAMPLIDGYVAADALWVPMSYGKVRVHGVLPAEVWSHVRLNAAANPGAGYATFDVTITDAGGRVVMDVERFTVKRLEAGATLATANIGSGAACAAVERHTSPPGEELPPALARLAAQVDQGILPHEGRDALLRVLGSGRPEIIVSSLDLEDLKRSVSAPAAEKGASAAFERPDLGSAFVAPRTPVEVALAGFWTELLGVKSIGVDDNFFDLGGHSLIAVRLFRKIKQAFAVDFPISVLFEAPTIAGCAELIQKSGGVIAPAGGDVDAAGHPVAEAAARHIHLVAMHPGKHRERTPFFICAGMFGNILNLRSLAQQIGRSRPVYGLQARGLYGDQAPHETFEDMAASYLAEIRSVQPHGPYLFGGFSGGGLVAYEMAQQLKAEGEEVAIIVMLDTPVPGRPVLSLKDRISMKLQDVQRDGAGFVLNWARRRLDWERDRRRAGGDDETSPDHFHNESIKDAFYRALDRYEVKSYDGAVIVLRPRLHPVYEVSGGIRIDEYRSFVRADNGWTPYLSKLEIVEVPGDHDGMVLEPNVRVLATHIHTALDKAEMRGPVLANAAE